MVATVRTDRVAREYSALILDDQVHGSLYTDAEIFADEMDRVFAEGWVYLGHESEVAEPGAFCTKMIGRQSVVMTRAKDSKVHAFYNRCPHRGNKVCLAERGKANSLVCGYHGWGFDLDGKLLGLPYAEGYPADFDKENYGLSRVPRLESYGGFVFASLEPTGISLDQHLGHGKAMIDQLNGLSPEGRVELTAGWMKHRFHSNWKIIVENQVDGYHAMFVHGSLARANKTWADLRDRREESSARSISLGGGHVEIDHSSDYLTGDRTLRWTGGIPEDRVPKYVNAMREAYGDKEGTRRLIAGPPHGNIFPNLFIAEMNIMAVEPVNPDLTIHYTTPVMLAGGGELNARTLRRCEGALGPSGFLIADDAAIAETTQAGLHNHDPEWLALKRGIHKETVEADGRHIAGLMDETPMRGFWYHYRGIMQNAQRG